MSILETSAVLYFSFGIAILRDGGLVKNGV